MKKFCFLLFVTIFLTANIAAQSKADFKDLNEGLNDLSRQISLGLSENQKRRIAVAEFVDLKGNITDLGRYLSEKLITKLFQTNKFKVIERQQLNKIITEQKLSLTGVIEPSSAQRLGRLLGVDAIATGSISDLSRTVEINARLISTETGEVFSAASIEIRKDESICKLLSDCNAVSSNAATDADSAPTKGAVENKSAQTFESNFFTFELLQCSKSGVIVSCNLTVTNKDTMDKKLGFDWNSNGRIYDDQGAKGTMTDWLIANQSLERPTLLPNVPVKATLRFKGISAQTKMLVKIELAMTANFSEGGYYKTRDFLVVFQNVTLR